jgi:chitinase
MFCLKSGHRRSPLAARCLGAVIALAGIAGCASVHILVPALPNPDARLVGYVSCYNGSYAARAATLNFSRMTHLLLAFGTAKKCDGVCTPSSDMTISLEQDDADVATLVAAAHAAGVKVILSIGGGDRTDDATISQFYSAGLSVPFAAAIDRYVAAHHLDGVDVDMEDPSNMGAPYGDFILALAARLHPQGKLLTAAVGSYLGSAIPHAALAQFDFLNVMVYSNYADARGELQYFSSVKSIAPEKLVLGVPFFGSTRNWTREESYAAILAAYPDAWQRDEVSGGSLDDGVTLHYVGESTMAEETKLGARYGGIMIWELTQDGPLSLEHHPDESLSLALLRPVPAAVQIFASVSLPRSLL